MGEVYRARDTKLGRDVALKVLPASFAADPERLARFEREAQALASLNHPHVAQIYGAESHSGCYVPISSCCLTSNVERRARIIPKAVQMTTILQEAAAGRATLVPWTVEQYHRAIASGLVPEDTAVELLDGFIVRKDRAKAGENPMTIGDRHRLAVVRLAHTVSLFEALGCFLQTQQPISLPPASEPEPDGAVVRGEIDRYRDHPPLAADILSVIEVADSSLSVDLGPKLKAYATAGIPQYVVADLVNDYVIIHEAPAAEVYARVTRLARGETIRIHAGNGEVAIAVDLLLP
jgi:Uma2 family endonuclease